MTEINPIDLIEREHDRMAALCDALEEVADRLPEGVNPDKAASAANMLRYELPRHNLLEEEFLFPLLDKRAQPQDNIKDLLAHLAMEHATDESYMHEILEHLDLLAADGRVGDPNILGYMLRGFFQGQRRHLAWENTVVLPLARRRLTEQDLDQLAREMKANKVLD